MTHMKAMTATLLLTMLCAASAAAQTVTTNTASIIGTVADSTGSVVPGAAVSGPGPALMGGRRTVTDANGTYRLTALPPGVYRVGFELQGFRTVVREDIFIATGFTSGGNAYHGSFSFDYQNESMEARNIDAGQIAAGLRGSEFLDVRDLNRLEYFRDLTADVGGYVKEDRVWWYASATTGPASDSRRSSTMYRRRPDGRVVPVGDRNTPPEWVALALHKVAMRSASSPNSVS